MAVYGPWGCGRCHSCQLSMENYARAGPSWAPLAAGSTPTAEYMLVPSARLLVPLGVLSPTKAAPLSDAALTPYHAIKRALPQLNADTTVVVIGVGGLGHMAIQLLRVLAPVRVIAPTSMIRSWSRRKRSARMNLSTTVMLTKPPSRYRKSPDCAALD